MIKYISVGTDNGRASGKARLDIDRVLAEMGFENIHFKLSNVTSKFLRRTKISYIIENVRDFCSWSNIQRQLSPGDVLIVQHPMSSTMVVYNALRKLKEKHVKIILIIHDIYSLRDKEDLNNKYYQIRDFGITELCDAVISHNSHMTDVLVSHGIEKAKIMDLELFDYLYTNETERIFNSEDKRTLVVAGNLDVNKAAYVYELGKCLKNAQLILYGRGFDSSAVIQNGRTIYEGTLLADELPQKIHSGFGLVWDGTSIDSCNGNTGEYLKINNPHKASCNIASGLPLIVWSQSAMADIVKKYGVGLCVDSLRNIDEVLEQITDEQFEEMIANVLLLSSKVRTGYFIKTAVNKALVLIDAKE